MNKENRPGPDRVQDRQLEDRIENETPSSGGGDDFEVQTFYDKLATETDPQQIRYLEHALRIAEAVNEKGGRALCVGGYTRDEIMRGFGYSMPSKDIDLEVYGVEQEDLRKILEDLGRVRDVGAQYEILLAFGNDFDRHDEGIDVAMPRREIQEKPGHGGVKTTPDPNMSFEEAFKRRDLTINAIGWDPLTGEIIDEYNGVRDIQHGVIRLVSEETFADDPVRPFRVAQFVGRFGFEVDPVTFNFARSVDFRHLDSDRVKKEWNSLLMKSRRPGQGFDMARRIGVIEQLHPEMANVISVGKDETKIGEGSLYDNLMKTLDEAAIVSRRRGLDKESAENLMLMTVSKDMNHKAFTFLRQGGVEKRLAARLGHMNVGKDFLIDHPNFQEADVRRLASEIAPGTVQELVWLLEAQARAVDPEMKKFEAGERLMGMAQKLGVKEARPKPIIDGGDIIKQGVKPGKEVGELKKELYDAQLDGRFETYEEGMTYLMNILPKGRK